MQGLVIRKGICPVVSFVSFIKVDFILSYLKALKCIQGSASIIIKKEKRKDIYCFSVKVKNVSLRCQHRRHFFIYNTIIGDLRL